MDFLIAKDSQPSSLVEVKTNQDHISKSLIFFSKKFKNIQKVQIVQKLKREKTFSNGIEIRKAAPWLSKLNF